MASNFSILANTNLATMSTLFVLDDDPLFHRLITLAHAKSNPYRYIHQYYEVKPLINYIWNNRGDHANLPDVLFVDINIPIVDGWDFLDALCKIYPILCKKITVYVITVSVRKEDKIRVATNYPFVKEYIIKPITTDKLRAIANNINSNLEV
jgi:CheY-like chemotaxis protein